MLIVCLDDATATALTGAGAEAARHADDRAATSDSEARKGVTSHQQPSRALHSGREMLLRPRSERAAYAVKVRRLFCADEKPLPAAALLLIEHSAGFRHGTV